MRILFLTSRLPFPPIGGDKLRVYNFMKYLSEHHEISLISFVTERAENNYIIKYGKDFRDVKTVLLTKERSYYNCIRGIFSSKPLQIYYYHSKQMARLIEFEIQNRDFDLIFVHLFRMAEYVKKLENIIKILDLTDAISLNYERSKKHRKGLFSTIINLLESKRVLRYETSILDYFHRNLLVSNIDKEFLKKFTKSKNLEVVPIGVDLDYFQFYSGIYDPQKIIFLGNMRTFPNEDAVVYFSEQIFPLIKKEFPDINFFIVGTTPSKRVRQLSKREGIIVTGVVDDVREYLKTAVVSVAPMRSGAGVQNKILESMAIGTPVITSSIGLEGIEAVPNRHILVADEPQQFAEKVIELLRNKGLRTQIAINARKILEEKYSWEKALRKLNLIIDNLSNLQ